MAKYVERLISVDLAGDCGRHWRRGVRGREHQKAAYWSLERGLSPTAGTCPAHSTAHDMYSGCAEKGSPLLTLDGGRREVAARLGASPWG